MTAELNVSGKKINELVNENILPQNGIVPGIGDVDRNKFVMLIRRTDAYNKFMEIITSVVLIGSDKQINWASEIRKEKATQIAFELVMSAYYREVDILKGREVKTLPEFNSFLNKKLAEYKNSDSKYWINNR